MDGSSVRGHCKRVDLRAFPRQVLTRALDLLINMGPDGMGSLLMTRHDERLTGVT